MRSHGEITVPTQELRKQSGRLLSGGMVAGSIRVATIVCILASNAVIARLLVKGDVGVYFTIWSFITFLALFGQLGLRHAVVKWVADALEKKDDRRLRAAIVTSTVISIVSFLVIAVGILLVYVFMRLLDYPVLRLSDVALVCIWTFGIGMQTALAEVFRGYARHDLAGSCGGLITSLGSLVGLSGLFFFVSHVELSHVLLVVATAATINSFTIFWFLRRAVQGLPTGGKLGYRFAIRTSFPMMVAFTSRGSMDLLDTVILGAMGLHGEAALYAAAGRIAILAYVPNQVVTNVIAPEIVTQHAKGDQVGLERVLRGGSTLSFLPAVAAIGFFSLLGGEVLGRIYQPAFAGAWSILVIACVGNAISMWNAAATPALLLTGNQRPIMFANLTIAVCCFLLQIVAAKFGGGIGVALVRVMGLLAVTVMLHWLCKSKLKARSHATLSGISREYVEFKARRGL